MNVDKSELKINNTLYLVEEIYSGDIKIEQLIEELYFTFSKIVK